MPVLYASAEPTAAARTLPPATATATRDKRPASAGFSSLVDDNAAAKADARPRTDNASARTQDTPRGRDPRAPDDRAPADTERNAEANVSQEAGAPAPISASAPPAAKNSSDKAETGEIAPSGDASPVPDLPAVAPSLEIAPFDPTLAAVDPAATADPVAIVIPVPVAPMIIPVQTQAPAPLAIAAAGIAAAKAVVAPKTTETAPVTDTAEPPLADTTADPAAVLLPDGMTKDAVAKTDTIEIKLPTGFAKTEAKPDEAVKTDAVVQMPPRHAAGKTEAKAEAAQTETQTQIAPIATDGDKPAATAKPHEHAIANGAPAADTTVNSPPMPVPQPAFHTVTAPSPTVQFTAAVAAAQPVPLNGLAVELAARATPGATRFEIRLDPAELGRIDVRIDIDKQGNVTSHLTVEKPETLAMLRQDAPQLQRALHDAGFKTSDSGMQFSLGDQQQGQAQQQNDNSQRQAQRLFIQDDEATAASVPVRNYGRMNAAPSGVDISV